MGNPILRYRLIVGLFVTAVGIGVRPSQAATVLVADNFDSVASGASINGRAPTTNIVNSNSWSATTATFLGNGSGALNVDTNQTACDALIDLGANYLSSNPGTYDLSFNVTEPTSGNSTSAWVAVGFAQANATNNNFVGNNGAPWVLYRDSGNVAGFAGPQNTNPINSTTAAVTSSHTIDVRLNTVPSAWTASVFVDGVQQGSTFTYTTNPTASRYIGMAATSNGTGQVVTVDNFQLAVTTPEPGSIGLLALAGTVFLSRRRRA